jgi:2-(1,2-epoxy-1,2-dihydrophenyl)acetyl-CoA isomerase
MIDVTRARYDRIGHGYARTRRPDPRLRVEGRHVSAAQALERGLVQEVVAPEEPESAVARACGRVTGLPPHALAMVKPLLRAAADAGWDTAPALEVFAEPDCFTTAPFQAAVRARLEGVSS